jgi:hypothetical protein
MRTVPLSTDQQLLAHLQAPPELRDGVESLGYWRERGRRLPWYRVLARREAARMTIRWEQRVRAALVSQRGVPVALRVAAGLLVARIRLRRWSRIALIGLTATIALALIAAPAIGTVVLLLHAF